MILDRKQVEEIAFLARLELTEEEKEEYAAQLSAILSHVAKLQELDTTGVPPTVHILPVSNVLREDEPGESLPVELALANAPEKAEGCFVVPRILEE
ncbi:MAG: Asp-tRNA(Asn)/Glu-tRNA(Gln) amidotransferase subunit GatC [bacterium]|jgi:aspartyl-tRNA(Asn)/glutamyl-tRNA(Gln) amidotransferase subunit C|nr:Asp-tRNA(Asn)/Glu-tRNA(Gln) amidotransferase subunit GatC [Bacillota bacterium]HHW54570.1 Asp-tRNA(Asn)/Glu-tRNA(Gln) amidotransferase subunit GatC [Bacillota bacterium]